MNLIALAETLRQKKTYSDHRAKARLLIADF
jgi:hypothetical protein